MQTVQDRKRIVIQEEGLLPSLVNLSATLGERTASACFGIVRDVHVGLTRSTLAVIELVEAVQQSSVRTLKSVVERSSRWTDDALDAGELAAAASFGAMRRTGRDATHLMSRTAATLSSPAQGGDAHVHAVA